MDIWSMIAQLVTAALMQYLGPAVGSIPGPAEAAYRKDVKADQKRLSEGGGGMGAGKLQEMQTMARAGIQAQQAEQQAQLARGGAGGAGTSGLQGLAMSNLNKNTTGAMRGAQSDIRAQDLAYAGQQRQDLMRRMENVIGMGKQAKAAWTSAQASPRSEALATIFGESGQQDLAQGLSQLSQYTR